MLMKPWQRELSHHFTATLIPVHPEHSPTPPAMHSKTDPEEESMDYKSAMSFHGKGFQALTSGRTGRCHRAPFCPNKVTPHSPKVGGSVDKTDRPWEEKPTP